MRVETKQEECRLVAENDLERYYLNNFFKAGELMMCEKSADPHDEETTIVVTLSYE